MSWERPIFCIVIWCGSLICATISSSHGMVDTAFWEKNVGRIAISVKFVRLPGSIHLFLYILFLLGGAPSSCENVKQPEGLRKTSTLIASREVPHRHLSLFHAGFTCRCMYRSSGLCAKPWWKNKHKSQSGSTQPRFSTLMGCFQICLALLGTLEGNRWCCYSGAATKLLPGMAGTQLTPYQRLCLADIGWFAGLPNQSGSPQHI